MVDSAAKQRLAHAAAHGLCVACLRPLESSRVIRGCHERCYRATVRAISRGDFSEQQRMAAGKLLPSKTGGGRPKNPVTIEARAASRDVTEETPDPELHSSAQGETTVKPATSCELADEYIDLNYHLGFLQNQVRQLHGVTIDLEDILWYFFHTYDRDLTVCTEMIVETSHDHDLIDQFSTTLVRELKRRDQSAGGGC